MRDLDQSADSVHLSSAEYVSIRVLGCWSLVERRDTRPSWSRSLVSWNVEDAGLSSPRYLQSGWPQPQFPPALGVFALAQWSLQYFCQPREIPLPSWILQSQPEWAQFCSAMFNLFFRSLRGKYHARESRQKWRGFFLAVWFFLTRVIMFGRFSYIPIRGRWFPTYPLPIRQTLNYE